jgi:hypothetical protein
MNYVPSSLSKSDQQKQQRMIAQSRKNYKKHTFFTRKKVNSFHSKPSKHILKAKRLYHMDSITPNLALAKATGCPLRVLKQIVKKGEGAYYSSGSRPNQTPQSWAYARLASAVTGGNASLVDYHLVSQCDPSKQAYQLATRHMK